MKPTFKPRSEYAKKLLDPRWQKLRLQVLERDKWTCQACGAKDKTLHAHHVFYWPEAEGPWDYLPSSIVTVCADCHEVEHEFWQNRNASLIEAASIAGFRTNDQFGILNDILTTLAQAVDNPEYEADLLTMISVHVNGMRLESSK